MRRGLIAVGSLAWGVVASCSATSGDVPEAAGGSSGSFSAGASGSGGSSSGGTSGADASAGSGGVILPDGGSGDATLSDGPGVVNDGAIDAAGDACTDVRYAPGPLERRCAVATTNECDGRGDIAPARPNGANGNGYDDDCDGRVDEGCNCAGGGSTKLCWLISPTQADAAGNAVGYCAENARGTVNCIGSGEFGVWDGECRGAQPPFASDVCALGDFDCDGAELNSKTDDCSCTKPEVVCPTAPIVTAPFPPPSNLPFIDGASWIRNAQPGEASNWKWTATGGDCDNILPHPSFQLFNGPNGVGPVRSIKASGLGPNGDQNGVVMGRTQGAGQRIHYGMGLSGDYLVKGEFDLRGRHYECTVKVQVRAPGIRAELCWTPMPNDVDLHFARLQRASACTTGKNGWFETCASDGTADDCYFAIRQGTWGYPVSNTRVCHGWASRREAAEPCSNPRLDFDNIDCNPLQVNPGGTTVVGVPIPTDFCGAENINLDNPKDGDRFAIAAHAYSIDGEVKPHVNVYCNGERKLSLGHQPGRLDFPKLLRSGATRGGDLWVAAVVQAQVDGAGAMTGCEITPVNSVVPKPDKDGSSDFCVDTHPQNAPQPAADAASWWFSPSGGYPTTPNQLCFH